MVNARAGDTRLPNKVITQYLIMSYVILDIHLLLSKTSLVQNLDYLISISKISNFIPTLREND